MTTQITTNSPPGRNLLSVEIPGLTSKVQIEFPTRRLPSCEKCKRQFKTRELCRVQKRHYTLPWSIVNICVTLDSSCFDAENKIVSNEFSSRTIGWQPYKFKEGVVDVKMLMCADCKNKNYTRSACRGREKYNHRHLPWSTVYCELSALPSSAKNPESKPLAIKESSVGASKTADESGIKKEQTSTEESHGTNKSQTENCDKNSPPSADSKTENTDESSPRKKAKICAGEDTKKYPDQGATPAAKRVDFAEVDKSRTFFIELSCKSLDIQWLDLGEGGTSSPTYGARFNVHQDFAQPRPAISPEVEHHPWYPPVGYYHPQLPQMLNYNPYYPLHQMYGLRQQLQQQVGPFSSLGYGGDALLNNPTQLPGIAAQLPGISTQMPGTTAQLPNIATQGTTGIQDTNPTINNEEDWETQQQAYPQYQV